MSELSLPIPRAHWLFVVVVVAVEEDVLPPTTPSTLRRRYHLLESSTWKNPSLRSEVQPSLGMRTLHLGARTLHYHHHSCQR
jgi:hypothetical protein